MLHFEHFVHTQESYHLNLCTCKKYLNWGGHIDLFLSHPGRSLRLPRDRRRSRRAFSWLFSIQVLRILWPHSLPKSDHRSRCYMTFCTRTSATESCLSSASGIPCLCTHCITDNGWFSENALKLCFILCFWTSYPVAYILGLMGVKLTGGWGILPQWHNLWNKNNKIA